MPALILDQLNRTRHSSKRASNLPLHKRLSLRPKSKDYIILLALLTRSKLGLDHLDGAIIIMVFEVIFLFFHSLGGGAAALYACWNL